MRFALKPWMVTLAAPVLLYLLFDVAVRIDLAREGWFDTWEYLRKGDSELGYRLRGGVTCKLDGAEGTHTNDDGFRAAEPRGRLRPKAPGEILVVTLGDSNTFGAGVAYEKTFPVLLQEKLAKKLRKPVRVENLGVLGYSIVQDLGLLKRWANLAPDAVVVTVNSYNDRAFVGRPDSPHAFEWDARALGYEFGELISYPVLFLHRRRTLQQAREARPPVFSQPVPAPRVPPRHYEAVLAELSTFARQRGFKLVFLTTSESADSASLDQGLRAFREGRLGEALASFERATDEKGPQFLPAYFAYRAAVALGKQRDADSIRARYVQGHSALRDRYLFNFSYTRLDYAPMIEAAAQRYGIPLVDLAREFQDAGVRFANGHYDAAGHGIVAGALADALESALGG